MKNVTRINNLRADGIAVTVAIGIDDMRTVVREELKVLLDQNAREKQRTAALREKMGSDKNKMLTDRDVQSLLNVSRSQVYTLRKEGKLKSYEVGGCIRYRLSDVMKCIVPIPASALGKQCPYAPTRKKDEDDDSGYRFSDIHDNSGIPASDLLLDDYSNDY